MSAIKTAWKTLTDSLRIVSQYGSYGLYPLLSFIIMLLVTFTLVIPLFVRMLEVEDVPTQVYLFLMFYLIYGVLYFFTTFFNVALVTSIAGHLDNTAPSLMKGLSTALQRSGLIALHSMISTALSLVSSLARKLFNPFFGGFIAPSLGKQLWLRWRQLSHNIPLLMAVPVIALDQPMPENIFKRAESLVKETWGERVSPVHNIGLLTLLILLPIVLLFAAPALQRGVAEHNGELIWLGSTVLLVSILIFTQVNALVNAIFALAAYRYGTTGKRDLFPRDSSYAEQAFVKPEKEPDEGVALTASKSTLLSSSTTTFGD